MIFNIIPIYFFASTEMYIIPDIITIKFDYYNYNNLIIIQYFPIIMRQQRLGDIWDYRKSSLTYKQRVIPGNLLPANKQVDVFLKLKWRTPQSVQVYSTICYSEGFIHTS
jgi:hypothetical protein